MDANIDYQQWADRVINSWIRKIEELGIGSTGQLVKSFESHVYYAAGGDLGKIEFAFAYYGKFTEWGVGRGVSVRDRDTLASIGRTKRRRKNWSSDVFNTEIDKLREMVTSRLHGKIDQIAILKNANDIKSGSAKL